MKGAERQVEVIAYGLGKHIERSGIASVENNGQEAGRTAFRRDKTINPST